ncbi:MAG: hypothetical protein KOO69_01500 [Victivallales bacterium]|nr:hypothetical protein [Victivallales bacterium]
MNIQAINLKSTNRRRQAATKATFTSKMSVVMGFVLVFGLFAACLNYRTWLNRNIARIDKETSAYRRKIHELNREIEDLRIRKESLSSWSHIQNRIRVLRLDLRLPRSIQTQNLVVNFDGYPLPAKRIAMSNSKVAMVSYNK